MPISIKGQRDFWAGLLYLCLGLTAVWFAAGYNLGSASRMGPGYFPMVLGILLVAFGAVSIARSVVRSGEPIGRVALKPLALVIGATVLFGVLLPHAGMAIALVALIVVSASASRKFGFDWTAAALMVVLVAFCVIVFVNVLGLPFPVVGDWFGEWGGR